MTAEEASSSKRSETFRQKDQGTDCTLDIAKALDRGITDNRNTLAVTNYYVVLLFCFENS